MNTQPTFTAMQNQKAVNGHLISKQLYCLLALHGTIIVKLNIHLGYVPTDTGC